MKMLIQFDKSFFEATRSEHTEQAIKKEMKTALFVHTRAAENLR